MTTSRRSFLAILGATVLSRLAPSLPGIGPSPVYPALAARVVVDMADEIWLYSPSASPLVTLTKHLRKGDTSWS